MNIILASTSTLFGGKYLEYLEKEITELFTGIDEVVFIPFARPGVISHEDYTNTARIFFSKININFASCSAHKFHGPKGSGFA